MKIREAQHIISAAAFLLITGCATTRINVTMQDQAGYALDHRILKAKDSLKILDEQYSTLAEGKYEKCRVLGLVVADIWPENKDMIAESRRLSAWATLFLYKEKPGRLTSLENEKRNLIILQTALLEFADIGGVWEGESEVVNRAITARLYDIGAFNAFVDSLRASKETPANDGGMSRRAKAVASIIDRHPGWCQSIGLDVLSRFPWRRAQK